MTANIAWSKKRFLPYVFTEQGVAMLSSILRSKKAVEVNVLIMRAFVEMRRFLNNNAAVFEKFYQIDQKLLKHDENFSKLFDALEQKKLRRATGQVCKQKSRLFMGVISFACRAKGIVARSVICNNYCP